LHGQGPDDVSELCFHEASELLVMTGAVGTMSEAEPRVEHAIRTGAAVAKLAEVIEAQGGDPHQIEQPELLPKAPVRTMLLAPRSGYIASIEAEQMGLTSMRLGAGRFKKGDQIDHRTGFILQAKIGDYCQAGEPLVEIHARSESESASVQDALLACYTWSDVPVVVGPLIFDTIQPS
jgi:pyrimidine-nucleoside phosphorylase